MSLLPLKLPRIMISIEDAIAEDVEDLREATTFRVIGEVDIEYMVDVGRITGEEKITGDSNRAFEDKGAIGGTENISQPIMEVSCIGEEIWDHSNHRPIHRSPARLLHLANKEETCNG